MNSGAQAQQSQATKGNWWLWLVGLSASLLYVDYVTGPLILFPMSFLIPILLAAWFLGISPAIGFAAVLSLFQFGLVLLWQDPTFTPLIGGINGIIRLLVFVLFAVLTDKIKTQQTQLSLRVKTLEGILPICAFCKQIRTTGGDWQPVEVYVSEHTPAQFSHGCCEECLRKNYPDFAED